MLLGIPSKPSEMLRGYPGSRTPSSKRQYWLPWGRDGIGGGSAKRCGVPGHGCSGDSHGDLGTHLEEVGLALAVDAREGCVDGALDAPDVADELGVAGAHAALVQLVEILPCRERGGGR